ncbi:MULTISPECIES: SafA/ExsA family spore coat assembly protein [unclassified Virgibacillus]|uniref:SafA/ExsA family spore coat assembly protein n=1 Tax=unclassified Virgibacillus TaxID=2620237 RepID=UPI0024DEB3D7|nr:SafA/ExsA family spore coat assembly protein [Virgibacillus sp. LDC-1]
MKIHIVQKGDTLWDIAHKYGVNFEELKQLNSQLSSPDMIMPGMKIKIPSSAKTVKKEAYQPPKAQQPYKEISPKPMPVIKEDDKMKKKEVVKPMPMPQPQMPPVQMHPQMMQMPMMEQELTNYTTINLPPYQESKEEKPAKTKPVMKPAPQPMPQPTHLVPLCCYVMDPCHPSEPFVLMANMQGGYPGPQQPMPQQWQAPHMGWDMESSSSSSSSTNMPVNPAKMGYYDGGGYYGADPYAGTYYGNPAFQQGIAPGYQMPPGPAYGQQPYSPMPSAPYPAYPTPPGFPMYRDEEDEAGSE